MKKVILIISVLLTSCTGMQITEEDTSLNERAKNLFKPLKMVENLSKEQVALGKKLYFETALSSNGTISCNSCHKLDNFGVDNEATSLGHNGKRGGRNSPTSLNSHLNFVQFWDGRAKDLADQAKGPILNPVEHGVKDAKEAMEKINTSEYAALFKKAFPKDKKPMTWDNLAIAIGEFEKTLTTPSRFDDYLNGEITALNQQERKGLQTFIEIGCTSCHLGEGLGGTMYQKLGLVKDYPTKDTGRHEVTGKRRDKFKFKVPGLRNITKTPPYFHDGSIKKLDKAIELMAEHQIGKVLTKEEVSNISAFLSSLEAKAPVKY